MKQILHATAKSIRPFSFLFIFALLLLASGCTKKEPPAPVLAITTLATGLTQPIGMEYDKDGRLWVAESGSGKNDGKIVAITPDGKKFDVIVNLESIISPGGESEGPSHLLFADGVLYVLGAHGKLYKAVQSTLKPGYVTVDASKLGVEDIAKFVLAYPFKNNTHESHPYNLTPGPNGSIYITDAAANAVLKREKSGVYRVVAELPNIPNPTPVGGPFVEPVPTGIYYDGQNFLVTTLTGFPFPQGKAMIYKMTPAGALSVYQQGFTTLVDIAEGGTMGRLVLEHGVFGARGFEAKTGRLVWADGTSLKALASGLNLPAGLKQVNAHTWYVTAFGDGSVLKITY